MRACVQRVSRASVTVEGTVIAEVGGGLLVLLGVAVEDTDEDAAFLAGKIIELRVFNDQDGKMNRSLAEVGGALLVVSQFTLLGDCRKGRRPSFVDAAPPEKGEALYQSFVAHARRRGVRVETGKFRAHMDVSLVNDGPVTLLLDTAD